MEIIFQEYNLKGMIRSIKIFRPTRGSGGTLAYKSKINGKVFTFEMGDEGDWQPNCQQDLFNSDFKTL